MGGGGGSGSKVGLAASETSDGYEEKQSAMLTSIHVDDDEEEEEDVGHGRFDEYEDSSSSAGSIPENVKSITLLQKKVKQLESILQEYRKKESRRDEEADEDDEYRLENTKG